MKSFQCLLGFGFLGASFMTSLAKENPVLFQEFEASLNEDQRDLYQIIKRQRLRLYLTGVALGTILALAYLYFNPSKNLMATVCLFAAIAWGFTYFYYMLMPKSGYMVNHLTSEEQNRKWVAVYRDMQVRYIGGFLLGALSYCFLCYGFVKC